jgi:hypothetical protein
MKTLKKTLKKFKKTKKFSQTLNNTSKKMHNFYKSLVNNKLLKINKNKNINKNSALSKFLEYMYLQFLEKQKLINSLTQ